MSKFARGKGEIGERARERESQEPRDDCSKEREREEKLSSASQCQEAGPQMIWNEAITVT